MSDDTDFANSNTVGGFNLDPQNDPVIATTDWGLDIKFHADWGSFGSVTTSALYGYCYFTMGSYGGTAVNWVIIGRASNVPSSIKYADGNPMGIRYQTYTLTNYLSQTTTLANYYKNNQHETSSDAGTTISNAGGKGLVYDFALINATFSNSVTTSEIPSGCILCVSEKLLYKSAFRDNTHAYNNNYSGSVLQSQMSNLYSTSLGFTSTQKSYIQAQTIKTLHYNNTSSSISGQYLFPLAGRGTSETFYIGTYLTTTSSRISYDLGTTTASYYWTRSGASSNEYFRATYVSRTGGIGYQVDFTNTYGVRPAFVLKL